MKSALLSIAAMTLFGGCSSASRNRRAIAAAAAIVALAERLWNHPITPPGMPRTSRLWRRSSVTGACTTIACAPPALLSATASTTPRCRRRLWSPLPPTSPFSSPRPACGRQTANFGAGKVATRGAVAATAPARTSGTMRRASRTFSRSWREPCARPSSATARMNGATRPSAAHCRSGRSIMAPTQPLTVSSAA